MTIQTDKILKIMQLVLDINENTEHSVSFDYTGPADVAIGLTVYESEFHNEQIVSYSCVSAYDSFVLDSIIGVLTTLSKQA